MILRHRHSSTDDRYRPDILPSGDSSCHYRGYRRRVACTKPHEDPADQRTDPGQDPLAEQRDRYARTSDRS